MDEYDDKREKDLDGSIPALEGSAKQVAWAEDIREKVFAWLDAIAAGEKARGGMDWGPELIETVAEAFYAHEDIQGHPDNDGEYIDYDRYDFSAAKIFTEKYGFLQEENVNGKIKVRQRWDYRKLVADYKQKIKENRSASAWIESREKIFGPWQRSMTYDLINTTPDYIMKEEYWKDHKKYSGMID